MKIDLPYENSHSRSHFYQDYDRFSTNFLEEFTPYGPRKSQHERKIFDLVRHTLSIHEHVLSSRCQRNDRKIQQRQALETVFPSDDDDDGAWKAWGAPDELGLPGNAGNVPFSSGTEGEQDGQEFEIAMRRMFSLQEKEFKCSNMDEGYKARLERAHKRLQRDLAAVQCSRTLPKSSLSQISAQVDGVGEIALEQLRSSTWVVKPGAIDEEQAASSPFCVVEMSLNAKQLALKIFQLGKVAMMLSSGARWQDDPQIEESELLNIFYIVVTNRRKPIVQPKKILHRYPPLADAAERGRFGIMDISMDSLIQERDKAEQKAEEENQKLREENLRLQKNLEEALKRAQS